ncbi:hypothetical protein LKR43_09440 [Pusillimonas sp. MFBS29]|uniref:hypothetical protein n=1 Tax=Pusillimonas sp. MFBS29 TaxID=2886690 RepID=UPI001D11B5C4|nr:hypothetical protein [Pusillimonas sp. MFBS29]MCC2596565.1 hypothetical protein [Pusillimonas sp. MFBS29]
MAKKPDTGRRGLALPSIDREIEDAKRALSGLSREAILRMAAHDWVHSRRLRDLLEDSQLDAETARRMAATILAEQSISRDAIAQKARSETASRAARASKQRYEPLRAAIKVEYDRWKSGQSHFHSANHFAKRMAYMHHDAGAVESTIRRWCTKWKRENSMQPAS